MDSNDNSTDKEDSCGASMDLNIDNYRPTSENTQKAASSDEHGSIKKLLVNQVPAEIEDDEDEEDEHTGEEDEDDGNDSLEQEEHDIEMKLLNETENNKNAGILQGEIKNHANLKSAAPDDTNNTAKDKATHSSNELPSSIQSPPSLTCENDDKTQSSCITSPHASTPGSTPPSATVVGPAMGQERSPANSSVNTPPTDTSTPKHSPESVPQSPTTLANNCIQQPINVVRNGTIPNAGKPLLSTMSKKLERSVKTTRTRKPKSSVAMYESEISENQSGIKLCIKKSDSSLNTSAVMAAVARGLNKSGTSSVRSRKSSRTVKQRVKLDDHENDEMDYEPKRKKERNTKRQTPSATAVTINDTDEPREAIEQTIWGSQLPEPVLFKIFQYVVDKEGCLPTLFRLGRVCSLWRRVSLSPTLWRVMDLSTWIKEKYRTELKLKWFVDNRCSCCTELNVSQWKVTDINCFLLKLAVGAPNLTSITLSGWKGFTYDHLGYLVENMKKLERIDLSSVNVEMNASKSAVGVQSLCNSMQVMGERLTHLYLAHNRLAGIPQLVNVLSTHCPNLVLLDLSNVTTQATSHGILHIEKLQQGCPKLKVLRITNSHITLSTASLQEMMDSPGFPELEELSVAVTDESRVIGDEHIQRILKSSSKLKLLDVRGCARLTHESLIRLPAWDIKHLFLSGCSVTRDMGSGLELIASKWAHSLIELDLAWANVQLPLDNALRALADKGAESRLAHLNLCGSSVSEDAVKEILANCPLMSTLNLSSCRGLPRGVKRQMQGPQELNELREVLKVQLKVKLPETVTAAQNEASSSSSTTGPTTTSANTNDGGGGGGGVGSL
ncbi:F-box/LRR-repeat protein 6 [Lucilia sericata]|uniref:F-box/LRR-repeat protein 6 n=1 Tax=Lucilia sericata TaxID=13632 RepID=UPI0018A7F2C9|nr:F-box/LRR-repeat protein 6 [Lucilia sericata]